MYQDKKILDINGTFDGQCMEGDNGNMYAVPGNYASKSLLVTGDRLRYILTEDGKSFFKQTKKCARKNAIASMQLMDRRMLVAISNGKAYKVLSSSISFFKLEENDEVIITIPKEGESVWATVLNVITKKEPYDAGEKF